MLRLRCMYQSVLSAVVLCQVLFMGFPSLAQAEQTLLSPDEPLQVKLNTGMNTEKSRYGDAFEAVLTDTYHYEDKALPQGTILTGSVHSARPSMMFSMPGYVTMDIKEIKLPTGETYQIDENGQPIRTDKVINPEANTIKKGLKSALPFTMVSAVDAIPLKYAAGMSTWQIFPISLAARMALGVAFESSKKEKEKHDKKNHPKQTRIAHGMLRGTGLPGAYFFVKPSPEPVLTAGSTIPLRFDKEALHTLFASGSASDATAPTKVEPVSEASELSPMENEHQEFYTVHAKVGQPTNTDPTSAKPTDK